MMLHREQAQGLVEFGLIIALVALLAVGGLVLPGPVIGDMVSGITASA
jgi:Flp pilus assembly pilin Flp